MSVLNKVKDHPRSKDPSKLRTRETPALNFERIPGHEIYSGMRFYQISQIPR
jgi:hypothetical protein